MGENLRELFQAITRVLMEVTVQNSYSGFEREGKEL